MIFLSCKNFPSKYRAVCLECLMGGCQLLQEQSSRGILGKRLSKNLLMPKCDFSEHLFIRTGLLLLLSRGAFRTLSNIRGSFFAKIV